MSEKISIIIPAYNVEKYIARCLDSLCSQSYSNLELIVVDDESEDDTRVICQNYADKDSRIQLIKSAHGGLSHVRNVGLDAATGSLIAFVDSDDYVLPDYIKVLYENMQMTGADISVCDYYRGEYDSVDVIPEKEKALSIQGSLEVLSGKNMLLQWYDKHFMVETVVWNKLYRRELFEEEKLRFCEGRLFEDVLFSHVMIERAAIVAISKEKLYVYVQRKDSIMGGAVNEKKVCDRMYVQERRLAFFEERGYRRVVQRLCVDYEKYCILYYLKIEKSSKAKEIKKELKQKFQRGYPLAVAGKDISLRDRVILKLFHLL